MIAKTQVGNLLLVVDVITKITDRFVSKLHNHLAFGKKLPISELNTQLFL